MTDMWIYTGHHVVVNVPYFGTFNHKAILSDIVVHTKSFMANLQ